MENRAWSLQLKDRNSQNLHIAVYPNFFPVAYIERGDVTGLDIDLLVEFCRATGLNPVFHVKKDFSKMWGVSGEWRSNVDMACGGIGMTTWRTSDNIEWSLPYFRVQRTVVFNKKDPIISFPRDVTGLVYGTDGSTGYDDARERLAAEGKEHLLVNRSSSDVQDTQDLLRGKVQGLVRGSFVGRAIVGKYPRELDMTEPWDISNNLVPTEGEVFAFPCRRGSGIAALLNVFIYEMERSGMLAKLSRRHYMEADQARALTARTARHQQQ